MRKLFQQIVSIIIQLNPNKYDFQKQSFTKVFRKYVFLEIQMKMSALESPFNKVTGLRPEALLKKIQVQVFSCRFCQIFKNSFFTEHLQTTAFGFFHSFCCAFRARQIPHTVTSVHATCMQVGFYMHKITCT